jgi:hypothetical protein
MPEPFYLDMPVHPRHLREVHEEARVVADPTPEEREKIEASAKAFPSYYALFYRGAWDDLDAVLLAAWTPAHKPPEGSAAAHYLRYVFLGGKVTPAEGSENPRLDGAKGPSNPPKGV